MIDATPIAGLRIRLKRTNPCGNCGHTIVVIGRGVGPHVAALHCAHCDRHRGWLPKAVVEFLLESIRCFGRPSEVITIKNSELTQLEAQHAGQS
jgi:hypothetical protein